MRIKTLQNMSKTVDDLTGDMKINISVPPFMISKNARIIKMHYVNSDQVMRPDIISFIYYGTVEFVDVILKANGISNPFCIKEGMNLMIPDLSSVFSSYKPIKKNLKPRTNFENKKRITPVDKKRLEFLAEKSKASPNGSTENLPPNMLKSDQKSKEIRPNAILLGANLKVKKPETSRKV